MNAKHTEKLFSYGTLRYAAVQLSTFGRELVGAPDTLKGYQLSQVQINDPAVVAVSGEAVHPILISTGDQNNEVEGMVFDISLEELELADTYEVDDYKRVRAQLGSGEEAWVYIAS